MTELNGVREEGPAVYNPFPGQADEIRVRFGPRPTQVIPLGWAETMLTELKRINPGLFGKLLVTASEGGR